MRRLLSILLLLCCLSAWGQKADLRKGNRQFKKQDYAAADISYRKGLLQDTASVAAHYNLAGNLYRLENYDEAAKQLDAAKENAPAQTYAADYWFNRGDVALAQQDWKTAVDAFKESLLLRPGDLAAKENYIYARNKLMEQQQQDQNQSGDGQQNQDQQDQNQNQNQNQDQQDQNQDQQQQQQPQPVELSPQQAQQLLQAIQEKEKQTQEKVDEKKAQAVKSRQKEKNW